MTEAEHFSRVEALPEYVIVIRRDKPLLARKMKSLPGQGLVYRVVAETSSDAVAQHLFEALDQ